VLNRSGLLGRKDSPLDEPSDHSIPPAS
jgi:hypothetical protein